MSLPISQVIKDLENPETIIPILRTLHYNVGKLHELPKSELKHLVSRSLNLTSSHQPFKKWCGIVVIQTIFVNYGILSNHGGPVFNSLIKVLETSNEPKVIKACIDCLNVLCGEIRGKPTLTREILTPKLPIIIQLYMDRLEKYPELIIKSLNTFIINHPTTFRPFGNKLNAKIITLLNSDFNSFTVGLKNLICQSFAVLPIIEKNEPEVMWYSKFTNVIHETVDILSIFKQLINIDQDKELSLLLTKFKFDQTPLFPHLQIDLSKPETVIQLSNRLEILINLIMGFLTTPLKFATKIPVGKVISLIGIIFNLNTKFVPFKRDIIDESIKTTINSVLLNIQYNALNLLQVMIDNYQGVLIMYLSSILSILETAIPVVNKQVDSTEILKNEIFHCKLLETTTNLLDLVAIYSEPSIIVRFVDSALKLVEPRKSDTTIINSSNGKKNKKNQAVPMADLLSHGHLFDNNISAVTVKVVRNFINAIISKMDLPANQYYKIMRYLVIEAVKSKQFTYNRSIPQELKNLLINAIIYPGFEKVSILPLVSSIMGNDPLLSVFNNPRFPPLPLFIKKSVEEEEEEDDEEEEEVQIPVQEPIKRVMVDEPSPQKRPKLETPVEEEKVFKPTDKPIEIMTFRKDPKIAEPQEPSQPEKSSEQEKSSEPEPITAPELQTLPDTSKVDDHDDSDFEMPEIDMDGDSDDE